MHAVRPPLYRQLSPRQPTLPVGTVTVVDDQTGTNVTFLRDQHGLSEPEGAVDEPSAVY